MESASLHPNLPSSWVLFLSETDVWEQLENISFVFSSDVSWEENHYIYVFFIHIYTHVHTAPWPLTTRLFSILHVEALLQRIVHPLALVIVFVIQDHIKPYETPAHSLKIHVQVLSPWAIERVPGPYKVLRPQSTVWERKAVGKYLWCQLYANVKYLTTGRR